VRDLAWFNLAIDRRLCGCDVVAVRVDDVAPNGYTLSGSGRIVSVRRGHLPERKVMTGMQHRASALVRCTPGQRDSSVFRVLANLM
jgi:hypothetical protein